MLLRSGTIVGNVSSNKVEKKTTKRKTKIVSEDDMETQCCVYCNRPLNERDDDVVFCKCCSGNENELFCRACVLQCSSCYEYGCFGCSTVTDCMDCGESYCDDCEDDPACSKCGNTLVCTNCRARYQGVCASCCGTKGEFTDRVVVYTRGIFTNDLVKKVY
jgi:hypothetical protein